MDDGLSELISGRIRRLLLTAAATLSAGTLFLLLLYGLLNVTLSNLLTRNALEAVETARWIALGIVLLTLFVSLLCPPEHPALQELPEPELIRPRGRHTGLFPFFAVRFCLFGAGIFWIGARKLRDALRLMRTPAAELEALIRPLREQHTLTLTEIADAADVSVETARERLTLLDAVIWLRRTARLSATLNDTWKQTTNFRAE